MLFRVAWLVLLPVGLCAAATSLRSSDEEQRELSARETVVGLAFPLTALSCPFDAKVAAPDCPFIISKKANNMFGSVRKRNFQFECKTDPVARTKSLRVSYDGGEHTFRGVINGLSSSDLGKDANEIEIRLIEVDDANHHKGTLKLSAVVRRGHSAGAGFAAWLHERRRECDGLNAIAPAAFVDQIAERNTKRVRDAAALNCAPHEEITKIPNTACSVGASATLAGAVQTTKLACEADDTGGTTLVVSMNADMRKLNPSSKLPCRKVGSVIPIVAMGGAGGGWPAITARLLEAATTLGDKIPTEDVWRPLANQITNAVLDSGGVPHALRPFVWSFLSRNPTLWSSMNYGPGSSLADITSQAGHAAATTYSTCLVDWERNSLSQSQEYKEALQTRLSRPAVELDAWKREQAEQWLRGSTSLAFRSGVCESLQQIAKDLHRLVGVMCTFADCNAVTYDDINRMPPAEITSTLRQISPLVGDTNVVLSALSVLAYRAMRALRNADASLPKVERASEFVQGGTDAVFFKLLYVPAEVALAMRATERLLSQDALLRGGRSCKMIDVSIATKIAEKKWAAPQTNAYLASFCDPAMYENYLTYFLLARLREPGSALSSLLSRIDSDAAFHRLPPIMERAIGGSKFNEHPSELRYHTDTAIAMEVQSIAISQRSVCDEELALRMVDFRLVAPPRTGQALTLLTIESLIRQLGSRWPAAAAPNNIGTTLQRGGASVGPTAVSASDIYDSVLVLFTESQFPKYCTPLFDPDVAAWSARVAAAFRDGSLQATADGFAEAVRAARKAALDAAGADPTRQSNMWSERQRDSTDTVSQQ